MDLKEILEKEKNLTKEYVQLQLLKQDVLLQDFRNNMGKFFLFDEDSQYRYNYVYIKDIYVDDDCYCIKGVAFYQFCETNDVACFYFDSPRDFSFPVHSIESWRDFGLIEISREVFENSFNTLWNKCATDFERILEKC